MYWATPTGSRDGVRIKTVKKVERAAGGMRQASKETQEEERIRGMEHKARTFRVRRDGEIEKKKSGPGVLPMKKGLFGHSSLDPERSSRFDIGAKKKSVAPST